MFVKICGLKDPSNAKAICSLEPDYVGLIFYPKSPRAVSVESAHEICDIARKDGIQSVGVFVDEDAAVIRDIQKKTGFTAVQLHGSTQVETAHSLRSLGFEGEIICAFAIKGTLPVIHCSKDNVSFVLFDAQHTPQGNAPLMHGGTGTSFDWDIIKDYSGSIPFFLSGGIGPENISLACEVKHPMLHGFDLNSKLESSPGIKDISLTKKCIQQVRNA